MTMLFLKPQTLLVGKGKHVKNLKVEVSVIFNFYLGRLPSAHGGFKPGISAHRAQKLLAMNSIFLTTESAFSYLEIGVQCF